MCIYHLYYVSSYIFNHVFASIIHVYVSHVCSCGVFVNCDTVVHVHVSTNIKHKCGVYVHSTLSSVFTETLAAVTVSMMVLSVATSACVRV